jgi:transcriptional regulator with XRE-family HTH domain
MSNTELISLGKRIAELRIARQLKQTELSYEAGVSHRTLQRLEAGEVVKTDGLINVLRSLGRLEGVMAALDSSGFSPYERLADAGLKVSQLKKQRNVTALLGGEESGPGVSKPSTRKRRVRHSRDVSSVVDKSPGPTVKAVKVQWPEDQR